MTEAPARLMSRYVSSPVVEAVDEVATPQPSGVADNEYTFPSELGRYIATAPTLVLVEKPAGNTTPLIRDLVDTIVASGKRVLIVVDKPMTLLAKISEAQSELLMCEVDEQFRYSTWVAKATRGLQTQLAIDRAELTDDYNRHTALEAAKLALQSHQSDALHHQATAEQRVTQSAAWQQHLVRQQQQASLQTQIDLLQTQLAQPVGFLQKLLGRAPTIEQQKHLATLKAELGQLTAQAIPDADLYQTLLATELEQLQHEAHLRSLSLQAELSALPLAKFSEQERTQKLIELEARVQALPSAVDAMVWANCRVLVTSPSALPEFDRPASFDKWILDSELANADHVRHCNRLASSGVLLGEVPTLRPPGYRNGTLPQQATLFEETWNELCTDGWAVEGTRLLAQPVRLTNAERVELKLEPIIGSEEHEARLLDTGKELTLAEVAFAAGCSVAQASQLQIEQTDLACLSTIGQAAWTTIANRHVAHWLTTSNSLSTYVADGRIELKFSGSFLAEATFDIGVFSSITDAQEWLAQYIRCSAPACVRTRVV